MMERKVTLRAHPVFKTLGKALLVEGTLLRPGVFVGLDGVPTRYTESFIKRVRESIIGKPIRFAHSISPSPLHPEIPKGTVVGFWTDVKRDGALKVRGYTFYPPAIEYLKRHPNIGLSMEANVITEFNPSLGVEEAKDGALTGGVFIDDPACPTCRVETTREVKLEKRRDALSATGDTTGNEPFIEFVDKNLAGPTRADFFAWLEKQMKEAGVPENIIGKVMNVLKKAIKTPYPYPVPESKVAEEFLSLLEGIDNKELSAYTDFMSKCIKGGKTMKQCALEWKEQKQKQQQTDRALTPREQELERKLAETRAELEALKKTAEFQLNEELERLTNDIKQYDSDFDPTKLLEGVSCKLVQKKMLQRYLDVLKQKVKPIQLQIGEEVAKQKVLSIVESMFGKGATFESIFEIPKREGD